MKSFISLMMLSVSGAIAFAAPAPNAKQEPQVRVQVLETSDTLVVNAGGGWAISTGEGFDVASLTADMDTTLSLRNGQLTVGEGKAIKVTEPILIEPTLTMTVVKLGTPGSSSMRTYDCPIELVQHPDHNVSAVAVLPMEEYLKGVVPHEIGTDSPLQAKCAQAVAARSFAMLSLSRKLHKDRGFHMCSTVCCQVYGGLGKGTPESDAAVAETRGQVLTFEGKPIPAYYAGNCGGYTEDIRVSWPDRNKERAYHGSARFDGPEPPPLDLTQPDDFKKWLASSPASYCNPEHFKVPAWAGKNLRWSREVSADDLTTFVARRQDIGRVLEIRIGERGPSGRLKTAEFVGEKGTLKAGPEYDIRRVFQPYLRSGAFTVQMRGGTPGRPDTFILTGAGSGHGVGMCQTGAMGMANAGKNFVEILKHYYSNAALEKLY